MKNRMKLLALSIFASTGLLFSSVSQAGILIEPFVGYTLSGTTAGGFDMEISSLSAEVDIDGTYTGLYYGGRLGYALPFGLGFGGEFEMASLKLTDSEGDSSDGTLSQYGVFVSYEFPIMLRIWTTYFLSSTFTPQTSDGDDIKMTGSGFKFGLGYSIIPMLAINLEYEVGAYANAELDTVDDLTNVAVATSGIILSLSMPLNL